MYSTGMTDLQTIDDALVRLRRLWRPSPRAVVGGRGRPVEMSSVLVVEACARGAETMTEVSVGDVATFADVEHSTASRLVDRAERSGLVQRVRSTRDTRRITVQLTPAGREVRDHAVAFRLGWLRTVLAEWPAADVAALADFFDRFARSVTTAGTPTSDPRG